MQGCFSVQKALLVISHLIGVMDFSLHVDRIQHTTAVLLFHAYIRGGKKVDLEITNGYFDLPNCYIESRFKDFAFLILSPSYVESNLALSYVLGFLVMLGKA